MAPKKRTPPPDGPARKAKAQRRATQEAAKCRSGRASAGACQAEGPHDALLGQLANVLVAEPEQILRIRKHGDKFSLIDVTVLVTGNDARYAAKEIGILGLRYPEVWNKIQHLKFAGPGQRETPVGDVYAAVDLIMLLPGKRAGLVRGEAARLFVRFYGNFGWTPSTCQAVRADSVHLTSCAMARFSTFCGADSYTWPLWPLLTAPATLVAAPGVAF